ncbi:restriction endonuclease [Actinomyces gaoshouyii]|uniref:restriction endonuclease n=1 Tax=Actinomyces gaoshouyii TaxID=1960083 RepID=UPI0009B57565
MDHGPSLTWSARGRRGRPDRGIDLVARRRDGSGMCAVQCKFYDPKHRVTKDDVDSFLKDFRRPLVEAPRVTSWRKSCRFSAIVL